jgi:hypothetical protein
MSLRDVLAMSTMDAKKKRTSIIKEGFDGTVGSIQIQYRHPPPPDETTGRVTVLWSNAIIANRAILFRRQFPATARIRGFVSKASVGLGLEADDTQCPKIGVY